MKNILAAIMLLTLTGCFFDKTETPVVTTPKSWVGHWSGNVNMGSDGKFGDGSWPRGDATILPDHPDARGMGYALGGAWEFWVAADGKLKGDFILHGSRIAIEVGQVPSGGNHVDFIIGGATGYVDFKSDNTVTGKIWEPGPAGDDWENHKFGIIVGGKQPN